MLKQVSSKAYIIRAIYEWCTDCGYEPQLLIFYHPSCTLPTQYIDSDNEVVFNISWQAVKDLAITDDNITFSASFDNGVSVQNIYIPLVCVKGIYALQNADGMMFDIEEEELKALESIKNPINETQNKNNQPKSTKPLLKRLK